MTSPEDPAPAPAPLAAAPGARADPRPAAPGCSAGGAPAGPAASRAWVVELLGPNAGGAEPRWAAALQLRHEVFTLEQGVPPELDHDAGDAGAVHAVACAPDGTVLGTGRLVAQDGGGRIGRMAVRRAARGQGVGRALLRALEAAGADQGLLQLRLHAQEHARGFYAAAGYQPVGAPFQEAGIAHVRMQRELLPGLRAVADLDGAGLARLIGACWGEYPGCVLDVAGEEPWLLAPATAYAGLGGDFWVLPGAPGVIRACVGWRPVPGAAEFAAGRSAAAAELKSLYVAAGDRRQGWGRVLVRLVERVAAQSGYRRVVLWSDTRFRAAHAFYARLGYQRTGAERDLHDRSATREYEFARTLGEPACGTPGRPGVLQQGLTRAAGRGRSSRRVRGTREA